MSDEVRSLAAEGVAGGDRDADTDEIFDAFVAIGMARGGDAKAEEHNQAGGHVGQVVQR